jgi:hypothetical protein
VFPFLEISWYRRRRYNLEMDLRRVIKDSSDVDGGRRLLGNIRTYLYIGAAAFLAVVYVWNHYR